MAFKTLLVVLLTATIPAMALPVIPVDANMAELNGRAAGAGFPYPNVLVNRMIDLGRQVARLQLRHKLPGPGPHPYTKPFVPFRPPPVKPHAPFKSFHKAAPKPKPNFFRAKVFEKQDENLLRDANGELAQAEDAKRKDLAELQAALALEKGGNWDSHLAADREVNDLTLADKKIAFDRANVDRIRKAYKKEKSLAGGHRH